MPSVCVFCGSSVGSSPSYAKAAAALGGELARNDITLVWGGGHVGLMGVVADAVLAAGGRTIGVIPAFMAERELAHPRSTQMHVVDSMHERKAKMAELADAFAVLPGGYGTLEELFEVLTWAYLGLHQKPIGLLNVDGFFEPLLQLVAHQADAGFVRREQLALLRSEAEPRRLLEQLNVARS